MTPGPRTAPAPSGSTTLLERGARAAARVPARLRQRRRAPAATSRSCGASSEADAGVLVGTQMVAKGHDFPDVVLSVVLDADATLRFPDFRAEERTFALVAQLAGRSGRGERGGRVLVQTLAPDAPAIRHAAAPRRRRASWPASSSAAGRSATRRSRTWCGSSSRRRTPSAAEAAADRARARRCESALPAGAELLGPAPRFRAARAPPPPAAAQGAPSAEPTVAAVREAVEAARRRRASCAASRSSVDVDPQ